MKEEIKKEIDEDHFKKAEEEFDKFVHFRMQNHMRYPINFRHLESYNMYLGKFPKATVNDYQKEMNREVTFDEFWEMYVGHIWEEIKHNPAFTH